MGKQLVASSSRDSLKTVGNEVLKVNAMTGVDMNDNDKVGKLNTFSLKCRLLLATPEELQDLLIAQFGTKLTKRPPPWSAKRAVLPINDTHRFGEVEARKGPHVRVLQVCNLLIKPLLRYSITHLSLFN